MLDLDLSKPRRQSAVGVVVLFFKNLRKAVNFIFYFFIVQLSMDSGMTLLWVATAIIIVLTLVYSLLVYQNFIFYVKGNEFVISQGVVKKEKVSVPFERIQSVHIDQNVIQRAMKVVGLKIDTAGSTAKELEISALPEKFARSIQEYLIEKKNLETSEEEKDRVLDGNRSSIKTPIIVLSLLDVVKVGLTENHLKTSLALFALINGFFWQSQEFFMGFFQNYFEENHELWFSKWLLILPLLLVSLFVISIVVSVVLAVLKYYGLKLIIGAKEIVKVSGLIKQTEYQIPINKVQWLKHSSNPLRKIFGFKTLVVKQASSNESNDKQSLVIPGCNQPQLETVINEFFPELKKAELKVFRANSYLKIQMAVLIGILPALIIGVLGFYDVKLLGLSIAWLVTALPLAIKYADNMKLEVGSELLLLSKGWIFPKTEIFKYYKLQSVSLKQNIFQKRRNVAHLDFYTAAGSLRMWQLDAEVVDEIYNYALYKIESSEEDWM